MDGLLELLIRWIISMLGNRTNAQTRTTIPQPKAAASGASNTTTTRSLAKNPRMLTNAQRVPAQRTLAPTQRVTAQKKLLRTAPVRRQVVGKGPAAARGKPPAVVVKTVTKPIAAVRPVVAATTVAAATAAPPAISATGIRQLLRSRPQAMRSIYAMSEILLPPVAYRAER